MSGLRAGQEELTLQIVAGDQSQNDTQDPVIRLCAGSQAISRQNGLEIRLGPTPAPEPAARLSENGGRTPQVRSRNGSPQRSFPGARAA